MTVGERIKKIRNNLGMSQVDFADKINVSKQTLYKYENNIITNIPSDKIEAAAHLGNVSPAYLMGWEQTDKVKASASIDLYNVHCNTEDECNLIISYRKLNAENKGKCSSYTSALLFNQELEEELMPNAAHESSTPYTVEERQEDENMLD